MILGAGSLIVVITISLHAEKTKYKVGDATNKMSFKKLILKNIYILDTVNCLIRGSGHFLGGGGEGRKGRGERGGEKGEGRKGRGERGGEKGEGRKGRGERGGEMSYNGTSVKGHSEVRTTSIQRTLVLSPTNTLVYNRRNLFIKDTLESVLLRERLSLNSEVI